jgi:ABC-type amino acid transport substrate-binding protein
MGLCSHRWRSAVMKPAPTLAYLIALACPVWLAGPAKSQNASRPDEALTVCLQSNDPPLSSHGGEAPGGFDLALSQRIAQDLGRELRVQWFVSRDDPDANLAKDANALLSDGRCQLLAEYPLLNSTLERPHAPTAKLPPFDGATPDDRHRWVKMNALAATRPYRLDTLTVVLPEHNANRTVRHLADLDGLRVGVQIATLSDAIAMSYGNGRLIEHVLHMPDARDLFRALQAGKIDAAFVDARAFDAWRDAHGSAGLAASGYVHSVAFNMGFIGLASNIPLITQVDAVLADLQAHYAVAPMAAKAGLTFIPPETPAVRPDVGPTALQGD